MTKNRSLEDIMYKAVFKFYLPWGLVVSLTQSDSISNKTAMAFGGLCGYVNREAGSLGTSITSCSGLALLLAMAEEGQLSKSFLFGGLTGLIYAEIVERTKNLKGYLTEKYNSVKNLPRVE